MKIGSNIKAYREKAGLTQKELAEKLFISPQAISRYENDEVEPNLDMIEKMSEVFECSIEDLVHGKTTNKKASSKNKAASDVNIIINNEESKEPESKRGTIICHDCHRVIREGEGTHTAKRRVDGATAEVVICNDCYEKGLELDKKHEEDHPKVTTPTSSKKKWMKTASGAKSMVAGIIVGVVSFIVVMCIGFTIGAKALSPGATVGLSFLALYGMLTLVYCIFSDTYITELFVDVATASVHVPVYFVGHILGGDVVILIPLKICGAIISACIGVFILGFAIALSMMCSIVSFPFIAISRIGK